jgi:hypothetical protein
MKTVSQAFKDSQKANLIYPVRKVELFRRLADGSGWEQSSIDITGETVQLDRLSWKLDTDALNEFKASNIRMEVDNSSRQWDGTSSRFSGFLLYRSKIRISLGLTLNGVAESFAVFNGVIEDVNEDSGPPTVQLDVQSLDAFLQTQAAESAGVLVINELLGIGDGVQSEFVTSQYPVGVIKEIRVNGEALRPGLRYSTSDLNDPLNPGKITFVSSQPGPGPEVRADYIIWKKDQAIHQVVNDLLATVPQVTPGTIEQVTFDPPVQREILHTLEGDFNLYELRQAKVVSEDAPPEDDGLLTIDAFDAKSKWQGGTVTNINFLRVANAIMPKWTSQYEGDFNPTDEKQQVEGDATFPWFEALNSGAGVTRSVANSILSVTIPTSFYQLENNKEDGSGLPRTVIARIKVTQINGQIEIGSFDLSSSKGAQVLIQATNQIKVQTGGNTFGPFSTDLTNFRNLRLQINTSNNTWQLFIDGSSVASGALGSAPAGSATGIYLHALGFGATTSFQLDYLRYNGQTAGLPVGTWQKIVDYGVHLAGLTSFSLITTLGNFFAGLQGASSAFQFFFSWSADGNSYSSEQSVSNGASLGVFTNVTFPRYVKFRIQVTATEDPVLVAVLKLFLPALATSNVIDAGSGMVSWDTWKGTFVSNDGQIKRFTAAVANSISGFSYYQAVTPSDGIQTDEFAASQQATAQKVVFIALFSTASANAPILRESLIDFTTRTVLVSMANLGDRSVLDIIDELAKIADFERGLDGDGKFFFRNKQVSPAPVLVLNDTNVERVNSFTPGWDRVYNKIRASFGSFIKEVNSATEGESPPTSQSQYGDRFLSVGGGNLVFQTDVDLATVMAKRYFSRYHLPKRRVNVTSRFMPEMELGDRVTFDVTIPRRIAQAFDARILGVAHDLMNFRTEFDLQEI